MQILASWLMKITKFKLVILWFQGKLVLEGKFANLKLPVLFAGFFHRLLMTDRPGS